MKNLSREIHENALKMAAEYKKSEAALVSAIQQVDEFRVYLEMGFGSLFEYVTSALGLSEASAYNFISVARKALEVPQIKKEIENGNLTVSKVRKVVPVITAQNQDEWLQKAMMLPQRLLEVEVAKVAPESVRPERVRVVSEERRELRIQVSQEVYEKLKRVQDLGKLESLEEVLEELTEFYLKKRDPMKKVRFSEKTDRLEVTDRLEETEFSKQTGLSKGAEQLSEPLKTPVLRQVRHQVQLRDRGRCTHVGANGQRCWISRYVEIHHVKPRSLGGSDRLENLATLCTAHHKLVHARGP